MKRAHKLQIVRAKEHHGGPSYRYASGNKPLFKALPQSHHRVGGLNHCRAIKVETMAINRVGVFIQAADLSHVIQDISNLSITFGHRFS